MKLYSYIITHDTGFAPNPFHGYCTLANCKPVIRRTTSVGDWIVGLSPKSKGNKVVYAMKVGEKLTLDKYFTDKRFKRKIPDYSTDRHIDTTGDNIYQPLQDGKFRQLRSKHSTGLMENQQTKTHDLNGIYVLVSKEFVYFGRNDVELPPELECLRVGVGHKCNFSDEIKQQFLEFISGFTTGVRGYPTVWSGDCGSCLDGPS